MFIATRAAPPAKLRKGGMYSRLLGHCRRSEEAKVPIHAAPELGRASWVSVTINMALLTELDQPPPLIRVMRRVLWRFLSWCGARTDRFNRVPAPSVKYDLLGKLRTEMRMWDLATGIEEGHLAEHAAKPEFQCALLEEKLFAFA